MVVVNNANFDRGNSPTILHEKEINRPVKSAHDRFGFQANEKGGQASENKLPIHVLHARELKWLTMLNDWDHWMTRKPAKIKERCRKGIPPALRAKSWMHLSGAIYMKDKNPDVFDDLVKRRSTQWEDSIRKDLNRTFPHHEHFSEENGQGQQDLYRVLKAFSLYDVETGFNQALAPVAAVLLMHMPAEDAFWTLVAICERYLPGYYTEKLEALQLDGMIYDALLTKTMPQVSRHMKRLGIDPLMYIVEWFMCIFARSLPFSTVLRIWDMFFCEGVKVLFRTGLAIVKLVFPTAKHLTKDDGMFETTQRLSHLPIDLMQDDILIAESFNLHLKEKDLKKVHQIEQSKRPDWTPGRLRHS